MAKRSILVIEHQVDIRRRVLSAIQSPLAEEYEILEATSSLDGLELARRTLPVLIILNPHLPVLSGSDLCRLLKKDKKTEKILIIFITKNSLPSDITQGLQVEADDFISLTCESDEFTARIQAKLRSAQGSSDASIQIGGLVLHPQHREAAYSGKKAKLTSTEYKILNCLAVHEGRVVTREQILNEVWKNDFAQVSSRTIDVHIRALRKKLPALSKSLTSTYGVGYSLNLPS